LGAFFKMCRRGWSMHQEIWYFFLTKYWTVGNEYGVQTPKII
jgi:hypothetical protein